MSTSPHSTVAHMVSWTGRIPGWSSNRNANGVPSPPTTPSAAKKDAIDDLSYLAAGQVAKLELNGGEVPGPTKHKVFLGPSKSLLYPTARNPNPSVIHNIYSLQQKQCCGTWYSEPQMYQLRTGTAAARIGQNAWPVQRNSAHIVGTDARAVLSGRSFGGGGAAVKRECAGTGVFLPRRYGNNVCNANSSDSRKRPGHSAASTPNRNIVAQTKSFDNMNGFTQFQPYGQMKFSRCLIPECDLLMARRHAIMLQHRRSLLFQGSSPVDHGLCLPQEWTY